MDTSFVAGHAKRNGNAIEFPIENGTYRVTIRVERSDHIAWIAIRSSSTARD